MYVYECVCIHVHTHTHKHIQTVRQTDRQTDRLMGGGMLLALMQHMYLEAHLMNVYIYMR